ncbi:MAG: biopolymer transporter ExbD [Gammaproteobacteria bacterium]|nr:biopolymer transporter ExbD [Gammaproteobacteria bacterium]MCZ6498853.1 biopolymer transporter ExbD [Gammaproteobacteria bacterium]MCZ6584494.1 biopolymer transporter ExbD [Gammaproteobacteria bacterium]
MRHRRSRSHRNRHAVELNITAFMNLMVILVPFLLITAVFSQVAILELNLPTSPAESEESPNPELHLEIVVREASIDVGDRATGVLTRIDNTADGYDLVELRDYLKQVKRVFPDKIDATLLLEPDISYQVLVDVMDTVRVYESRDPDRQTVAKLELFPEIAIGDAPLLN